jgi:Fic family protein
LILLDELFMNPYMFVAKAERVLKVSNPTARQAVRLLEEQGMLKEVSGRTWGRLYLAKPIMNLLQPPSRGK